MGLVSLRYMRVLFAISVVALVALLWAMLSIVSFVRKARRKQRAARGNHSPEHNDFTGAAAPPPKVDHATAVADLPLSRVGPRRA